MGSQPRRTAKASGGRGPRWLVPVALALVTAGVVAVAAVGAPDSAPRDEDVETRRMVQRLDGLIAAVSAHLRDGHVLTGLADREARRQARRAAQLAVAKAEPPPALEAEPAASEATVAPAGPTAVTPAPALAVPPVAVPPPPGLKLTGILWQRERPLAIVNGRLVGPGDTISRCRVLRIEPGCVVVWSQNHEYTFSLHRDADDEEPEQR